MIFGYFTLFVALLIEVVGAYYSITGLAAIFSGAVIPILIMGGSLEIGKVTAAVWLKNNWHRASVQFKAYLLPAVVLLMFITSMGIFGFLSKAHNDQNLVSGDVQSKIAIYDEKIKIQKDNIESARKALQQMDAAVDQTMARSTNEQGADKATAIRRSQARERTNLQNEIARAQAEIVKLNDQRAPIAAEVRKVEAEVGPIKYIAKLIYGDNPDANILEKAVVWVIIMIVAVFDPLALVLILAAQQSIRWARGEDQELPKEEQESTYTSSVDNLEPVVDKVEVPEEYFQTLDATETKALDEALKESYEEPNRKKTIWEGFGFPLSSIFKAEKLEQASAEQPVVTDSNDERPGDYLTPRDDDAEKEARRLWKEANPEKTIKRQLDLQRAGAINDVPWHAPEYDIGLQADNVPHGITGEVRGFGTQFPAEAHKGDMFLRVDRLPSQLYKFNGINWMAVDKNLTDNYTYDDAYIEHLISKIDSGEYDLDLLSDGERDAIESKLRRT